MEFPIPRLNHLFSMSKSAKGIASVFGEFGVGKTTFALQTAVHALKQKKKVAYIYTKPSFPFERMVALTQINNSTTLDDLYKDFILIQIENFKELYELSLNFEFFILNHLKDKPTQSFFVVFDSVTDLYRIGISRDKKEKTQNLNFKLNQILATLAYLNEIYNLELLIVNEITHKSEGEKTLEVQSGGKVMDYWVAYSIKIIRTEESGMRRFELVKYPNNVNLDCTSKLSEKGFE